MNSHLFHISYQDLGEFATLKPRVPETAAVEAGENNTTPRISVCPRIADCFRLFPWKDFTDEVYVYVLDEVRAARSAVDEIPDWQEGFKEEWWLLATVHPNVRFRRIGKARMFRIPMALKKPFWTWVHGPGQSGYNDEFLMTEKETSAWVEHERKSQEIFEEMAKSLPGKKVV